MYRSHDGYENVWETVFPEYDDGGGGGDGPAFPLSSASKNGKSTGMSTVIGIDEILSFRPSVAPRGNGSGFGGLGVGIQCGRPLPAAPGGGLEDEEDEEEHEGWEERDPDAREEDAMGSSGAGGGAGHRDMISVRASVLEGCRRRTARRSGRG